MYARLADLLFERIYILGSHLILATTPDEVMMRMLYFCDWLAICVTTSIDLPGQPRGFRDILPPPKRAIICKFRAINIRKEVLFCRMRNTS